MWKVENLYIKKTIFLCLMALSCLLYPLKKVWSRPIVGKITNVKINQSYKSKNNKRWIRVQASITIWYGKGKTFLFTATLSKNKGYQPLLKSRFQAKAIYRGTIWRNASFYFSRDRLDSYLTPGLHTLKLRIKVEEKEKRIPVAAYKKKIYYFVLQKSSNKQNKRLKPSSKKDLVQIVPDFHVQKEGNRISITWKALKIQGNFRRGKVVIRVYSKKKASPIIEKKFVLLPQKNNAIHFSLPRSMFSIDSQKDLMLYLE
ncbi:MAG: hypothetical protein D6785_10560, partial [Planctomycetota bacterium]